MSPASARPRASLRCDTFSVEGLSRASGGPDYFINSARECTIMTSRSLLRESRAQGEFNSLYMILVLIIAALLLITVVKPMFRQSQSLGSKTPIIGK